MVFALSSAGPQAGGRRRGSVRRLADSLAPRDAWRAVGTLGACVPAARVGPVIATAALAYWLAVAYLAADVACSESGHDYRDGAHVLAVVRARARSDWARYDGTLLDALTEPHQHAHGCRAPITWRHGLLGVQFITDTLPVEPWARDALWYCGDYDAPETCEARGAVLLGTVRHSFWGRSKHAE